MDKYGICNKNNMLTMSKWQNQKLFRLINASKANLEQEMDDTFGNLGCHIALERDRIPLFLFNEKNTIIVWSNDSGCECEDIVRRLCRFGAYSF